MKSITNAVQKICKKVNKSFLKGVAIIGGIFIIYLLASKYYNVQVEPFFKKVGGNPGRGLSNKIKKMKKEKEAEKKRRLGIRKIRNQLGEVSGLVADNTIKALNNEETLGELSSTAASNRAEIDNLNERLFEHAAAYHPNEQTMEEVVDIVEETIPAETTTV